MSQERDGVDLREIGIAIRRGWPMIAVGALLGTGAGWAVTQLVSEQYRAEAKVLVRSSPDLASSALSQLGGLGDILGTGGALQSELDTELEILSSRPVVGEVVDSLLLQAVVRKPSGVPANKLFRRVTVAAGTAARRYEFTRSGEGFVVTGEDFRSQVAPGGTLVVPGAELVLETGPIPDEFTVDLLDRTDAVDAVRDALKTESLTADVAGIQFSAGDPVTAAEVPNRLITEYLARRQTTDRGVNQYRYEFLIERADSLSGELASSEEALRRYQELSGVVDPQLSGETQLTRAMELQGELETIDVEARALQRIINAEQEGSLSVRELAAFPTFLRNAAIGDVLARLLELETERFILSQTRSPRDDQIIGLNESIANLESQLRSLSIAYIGGLAQQRAGFVAELARYRGLLDQLPSQEQEILRLRRKVEGLSEIQLVLNAELVQARLAAIGEGGEVREIEAAEPPKKPAFPTDSFVLLLGLVGGAFFGTVGAVGSGLLRQKVSEPWEVELATGVPASAIGTGNPLAFPEVRTARSLLLVPMYSLGEALRVGEHIVQTARVQGQNAVLVDLTKGFLSSGNGKVPVASNGADTSGEFVVDIPSGPVTIPVYRGGPEGNEGYRAAALAQLEKQFTLVVAVVPNLQDPETLVLFRSDRPAILIADPRSASRTALKEAVNTVERFGGRLAGIVLDSSGGRAKR